MEYCAYDIAVYSLYRMEESKRELKFIVHKWSGNPPGFFNSLPTLIPVRRDLRLRLCFLHIGDYSVWLVQNFLSITIFFKKYKLSCHYVRESVYLDTYIKLHHCKEFLAILKQKSCFSGPLGICISQICCKIKNNILVKRIWKVRDILLSHKLLN